MPICTDRRMVIESMFSGYLKKKLIGYLGELIIIIIRYILNHIFIHW